jgi:spore germination cell wall hydrolase CwlJ-like protein
MRLRISLFSVALLAGALAALLVYREGERNRKLEAERRDIACLARNVYFEGRGEPLDGQYAIAEITMNRSVSGLYPRTVCAVVYQKGAFSWTDATSQPEPAGEEWMRAWNVAEAVFYGRQAPRLQGALFYHASSVRPDWARDKRPVARIGNHIFYR